MTPEEVRKHWQGWAEKYGTDVRATSYTKTLKELEIACLIRWFKKLNGDKPASVLEAGCGNGFNCFALATEFPLMRLHGFDNVEAMIANAIIAADVHTADNRDMEGRCRFRCADLLNMPSWDTMISTYNVAFTVRCLINLDSLVSQKKAISLLAEKVKPGGYLLLMENSLKSYAKQNRCRRILDMPERKPPPFNLFLDENKIDSHCHKIGLELIGIDDFVSLHDLVLYVLLPAISHGDSMHWEYEHPMMDAVTKLLKGLSQDDATFGFFGQEALFVYRKL